MVRLMEIQELDTVVTMYIALNKEANPFIEKTYWDTLQDTMVETLGNSNVYVYDEHDVIKGFTFVVEGYYLGGVFVEEAARRRQFGTELVSFVKSRYDELVVSVYDQNETAKAFVESLGFAAEESEIEEQTGALETTYAWFSPNE